jgi:CRP-like cAMP-binding protein
MTGSESLPSLATVLQPERLQDLPVRELQPHEMLVRRGEHGGEAFWVESGELAVLAQDGSALTTVSAGSLIGEFVALVGGERTASVRAEQPSRVRVVPAHVLEEALADDPALAAAVRAEAVRRINETQVHDVLGRVLGPSGRPVATDMAARGRLSRLAAGDVLFDAGDAADSAFVVVSGRLRRRDVTAGQESMALVGVGSIVGEEGLVGGQRRRISLDAVRDTTVLEIEAQTFRDLLEVHPHELAPLALRLGGGGLPSRRDLDRTIAVAVTSQAEHGLSVERLCDEIARLGSVM